MLRVVKDFDRDLYQFPNGVLVVEIRACDSGIPALCTTEELRIRVDDVNDNSPTFSQNSYSATISERAQAGDAIIPDSNAQVRKS